jgi:UDP-N-acetylmuramoyl-L-alanine---L-glutamate ligase
VRLLNLNGRRIVVWGAGVEGQAAIHVVRAHTSPASLVMVVDQRHRDDPDQIGGVPVIESVEPPGSFVVSEAEVIVKSPGVSPYHGPLHIALSAPAGPLMTGGTAIWFAEAAAAPSAPLTRTIAVTGSKGKSTTSSLIAHLLRVLTDDVVLAGNVGRAPLDVLEEGLRLGDPFPADRWHVFELSSFQAFEVQHSPATAVLTSLFPEHLDWHGDVEQYYADKVNLFGHGVVASVVNRENTDVALLVEAGRFPPGTVLAFGGVDGIHLDGEGDIVDGVSGQVLVTAGQIPLTGRHNAMNVCAAFAALRGAGFDLIEHLDELLSALKEFKPLDHRLQPVGHSGGRLVIDDSLSTAPQAAIAALASFPDQPVGIIIGGHDRGLDYTVLAEAFAGRGHPTWIATVPESGQRVGDVIRAACLAAKNPHISTTDFAEFDDAVGHLAAEVPDGGVLLLSPGAPSFGRFRNYQERGLHFRRLLGL